MLSRTVLCKIDSLLWVIAMDIGAVVWRYPSQVCERQRLTRGMCPFIRVKERIACRIGRGNVLRRLWAWVWLCEEGAEGRKTSDDYCWRAKCKLDSSGLLFSSTLKQEGRNTYQWLVQCKSTYRTKTYLAHVAQSQRRRHGQWRIPWWRWQERRCPSGQAYGAGRFWLSIADWSGWT